MFTFVLMLQIQHYIDYTTAIANSVAIAAGVYAVFGFLKKSMNVDKFFVERFKKTTFYPYLCPPFSGA
jgi:hypothetical protein